MLNCYLLGVGLMLNCPLDTRKINHSFATLFTFQFKSVISHFVASVSYRPYNAQALFRSQATFCGIYGGHGGTVRDFPQVHKLYTFSVIPPKLNSIPIHSRITKEVRSYQLTGFLCSKRDTLHDGLCARASQLTCSVAQYLSLFEKLLRFVTAAVQTSDTPANCQITFSRNLGLL